LDKIKGSVESSNSCWSGWKIAEVLELVSIMSGHKPISRMSYFSPISVPLRMHFGNWDMH